MTQVSYKRPGTPAKAKVVTQLGKEKGKKRAPKFSQRKFDNARKAAFPLIAPTIPASKQPKGTTWH